MPSTRSPAVAGRVESRASSYAATVSASTRSPAVAGRVEGRTGKFVQDGRPAGIPRRRTAGRSGELRSGRRVPRAGAPVERSSRIGRKRAARRSGPVHFLRRRRAADLDGAGMNGGSGADPFRPAFCNLALPVSDPRWRTSGPTPTPSHADPGAFSRAAVERGRAEVCAEEDVLTARPSRREPRAEVRAGRRTAATGGPRRGSPGRAAAAHGGPASGGRRTRRGNSMSEGSSAT